MVYITYLFSDLYNFHTGDDDAVSDSTDRGRTSGSELAKRCWGEWSVTQY